MYGHAIRVKTKDMTTEIIKRTDDHKRSMQAANVDKDFLAKITFSNPTYV